ncbi:MAG: DUF3810 domain-containing protein [Flavobacteriales bacterium CG_4_8_14_3_um_filter_35_10]|nr:MAG: DUF3810 domain-containing protein [Flavobacteriales bacterium CG_4_8_14_3_um_filter_35_10]
MKKIRLFWLLLALFITQIIVVKYLLAYLNINHTSSYHYFYTSFSKFQRQLFGWTTFSVGDLFYTLLIVFFIYIFFKWVKNIKKNSLLTAMLIIGIITVMQFCFYLFWGFNYSRAPLAKFLKLDLKTLNANDLILLNTQLIAKANFLQSKLAKADSLKVSAPYNRQQMLYQSAISYNQLAQQWPEFSYKNQSIKWSLYSVPLSYMGYSGYYNPFSGEAQVNSQIVAPFIPFTACHEMAHQLGFAAEQEANFLSYLACINSQDDFIKYSGYLVALSYSLSNLSFVDRIEFKKLVKTIHPGILKNMQENDAFWSAHQNPSTKVFAAFYDHFLKANKQTDGIKSYYGIVKLIIAYHQTYPLKKS